MQAYLEGDTTGKDRSSHAMPLPLPGGPARQRRQRQATLGCDVPAGVYGVGPQRMLSLCGRGVPIRN